MIYINDPNGQCSVRIVYDPTLPPCVFKLVKGTSPIHCTQVLWRLLIYFEEYFSTPVLKKTQNQTQDRLLQFTVFIYSVSFSAVEDLKLTLQLALRGSQVSVIFLREILIFPFLIS